ncbi:MAG: histidine phosphatase family protein [Rhodocyclaceae bacterium]
MNDSTILCVARHGETDWNTAGILQGWIDVPINANGRQQAYELAENLGRWRFQLVFTSPLRRASETASIVAEILGLPPPLIAEGLRERNFGLAQGKPKSELSATDPNLYREILRRNPACEFEQGETMDEFADRVLDSLKEIANRHAGARMLVITHGWVMDVITRHIGHLPRSTVLNMKRKNIECVWLEITRHGTIAGSSALLMPDDLD